MSPDQLQQLMNQQMQSPLALMPFWEKALVALQILSLLMTVICLPIITWRVLVPVKKTADLPQPSVDDERLREIRARREALEKITGKSETPDDDSRFHPPQ